MNFSFKSLFAIWSLSPQRFHYYFFLNIVSCQYQKYSTIPILVLCLLCATLLRCSSYSSFAPSSPYFSSWWQKIVSYLHIHLFSNVLHWRRRVSPRRPMYLLIVGLYIYICVCVYVYMCQCIYIHVCVYTYTCVYLLIVGLHCCVMHFAYALHMRHQSLVSFPCLYIEPFTLVIEKIFHYCTTPPCHKINLFKRPF